MDRIELFRAGDPGPTGRYTEKDLDRVVASYDPKLHQAPVVIGHPEHDKQAYGWVESLERQAIAVREVERSPSGLLKSWCAAGHSRNAPSALQRPGRQGSLPAAPGLSTGARGEGLADAKFPDGALTDFEFSDSPSPVGPQSLHKGDSSGVNSEGGDDGW